MIEVKSEFELNPIFQAALEIQNFFLQKKWKFCFIGGMSVLRWGEPRMTQDVDASLLCGFGSENPYIDNLLANFDARVPEPGEFARSNRVLLLYSANKVALDITLTGLDYEEEMISRATKFEFAPNCKLVSCSAEDLIIGKAFGKRTRDWMNVESIIQRQRGKLDNEYILSKLTPLSEIRGGDSLLQKLEAFLI